MILYNNIHYHIYNEIHDKIYDNIENRKSKLKQNVMINPDRYR